MIDTAVVGAYLYLSDDPPKESHCTLRTLAACVALALLASSLLGVLGLFGAVFEPFQYTVAFYNVVFRGIPMGVSLIGCLMTGHFPRDLKESEVPNQETAI